MCAELSAQNCTQLYVPIGYAHGFCTLEDEVLVLYKVSKFYVPTSDSGLRFDDERIGVKWPYAAADLIISQKDRNLPLLKDFVSPYGYDGYPMTLCPAIQL
jgi:dTDP-4-dehydrorhamnose 3,5-epimerase